MTSPLFANAPELDTIFSYYGTAKNGQEQNAEEFKNHLWDPTKTTWVGLTGKGPREGSIGIAVPHGFNPKDRKDWTPRKPVLNRQSHYYMYDENFVDVHFDKGRKVKNFSLYYDRMVWLKDYTGGVEYKFERTAVEKPAPKIVLDRLGNELNAGDFICYVGRSAYSTAMGDIFFGFVERKTDGGTLFVKNIKLDDKDKQRESRITSPDRVTKLNKDVIDQLMLRRLTF